MKNVLRFEFTQQGLQNHRRNDPANTSSINGENLIVLGILVLLARDIVDQNWSSSFVCVRDHFAEFPNGNRGYEREGWPRRFFENWRASLKWQRLKPYEKFAEMIDRHWDGIAAYCRLENKVSLGFLEGLNNKIRVIQRRAYGLRNEDYLRLKILAHLA